MNQKSETVVFFGSGPVGAKCLELLTKNFTVEAVITKPKSLNHKGDVPVISTAKQLNVPTFTVSTKQELNNLMSATTFQSNLAILIDFGIIVTLEVIEYFKLGIINSHFSLLPRWRGADPISFSILNGDKKTGVSLMLIDEGLDTGKLIAQKSLKLDTATTTPELTQSLIALSDQLLQDYIPKYIVGKIKPKAQPHPERATYSKKLVKTDGKIDWSKPAQQIQQQVRAFLGWPGSYTNIFNKDVILLDVTDTRNNNFGEIGEIQVNKALGTLEVQCGSGTIFVNKLKPASKNEMTIKNFLSGYYKKD